MTKGGLYLPMPEHVEMFCETSSFVQCHQYVMGCELIRDAARRSGYVDNESRRQYRRVNERISLVLANCLDNGEVGAILDDQAFTIDLSLGGVRIASETALSTHKKLAFTFGEDFSTPAWTGVGEVCWTDSSDNGKFLTGLAFTDNKTFQVVGQHMGLIGLPNM